MNCGSDDSLDITDAITIEAWVKNNNLSEGKYIGILSADDGSSGGIESSYSLSIKHDNSYDDGYYPDFEGWNILFGIRTVGQSYRNRPIGVAGDRDYGWQYMQGCAIKNSYSSLVVGNWLHLVGMYDGTETKLYINGNYEATSKSQPDGVDRTVTGNLNSTPLPREIGKGTINGTIDEVRIYDAALEASQIKARYVEGLNKLHADGKLNGVEYYTRLTKTEF